MKCRTVVVAGTLGICALHVGVVVAVAAPAAPDPNQPVQVTVNCTGGQTIQAALAKIPKWTPARINVKGTCHERAF